MHFKRVTDILFIRAEQNNPNPQNLKNEIIVRTLSL